MRAPHEQPQKQHKGLWKASFPKSCNFLSDQLTKLRAEIEASLDFPDEDLKETKHRKSLGNKIGAIQQKFKLLLASTEKACRVREGITVVLSGKPNVGKSSLMNTLCGHERAIVNHAPGTTRDTLDETILLDGFLVRLIDTAGIRDTKNPIEREGVARAKKAAANADCILHIIDASVKPTEKTKQRKNTIIVKNKIDLTEDIPGKNSDNEREVFCLSAVSKEGVDELVDHLKKFFGSDLNPRGNIYSKKETPEQHKRSTRFFCSSSRTN